MLLTSFYCGQRSQNLPFFSAVTPFLRHLQQEDMSGGGGKEKP